MDRLNLKDPDFDELREHDGFNAKRARLGYALGAQRLGLSLWELGPEQAAYPYHFHFGDEELLVVLEGVASLRTPDGWSQLRAGDVVSFPRGESGAHQLVNHGDAAVRFLAVSTSGDPDVVIYPDSGKLGAAERPPHGGGLRAYFRLEDQVDYWDGEGAQTAR